jgi:hypothetical protein
MDYRDRATTRASDAASRRILARLWNTGIGQIDGWPGVRLMEPPVKPAVGPAWEDFSEGLRADVERELTRLTEIHRNKDGQRSRPCKPSTLMTRRRELVAAARMAVKIGIPIESLTSLSAVVHPDIAEKIIDGYWRKDGEVPTTYTINLICRFVGLAHENGFVLRCVQAERIAAIERHRDATATPLATGDLGLCQGNLGESEADLRDAG